MVLLIFLFCFVLFSHPRLAKLIHIPLLIFVTFFFQQLQIQHYNPAASKKKIHLAFMQLFLLIYLKYCINDKFKS